MDDSGKWMSNVSLNWLETKEAWQYLPFLVFTNTNLYLIFLLLNFVHPLGSLFCFCLLDLHFCCRHLILPLLMQVVDDNGLTATLLHEF